MFDNEFEYELSNPLKKKASDPQVYVDLLVLVELKT